MLDTIKAILEKAGCAMSDVIRCDCTLEDSRDFDFFNSTYPTYFPKDPPTRSTTVGQLVLPARVEIGCIAYHPLK